MSRKFRSLTASAVRPVCSRAPFVGFRTDSPEEESVVRASFQGTRFIISTGIVSASHKFSTHFPLRKKNALKKAFPALRFLELDNMQKVVPESFEFVPEHGYARLILRRKTELAVLCSFVTRMKIVPSRLSTYLLVIIISKNVHKPSSVIFNEARQILNY